MFECRSQSRGTVGSLIGTGGQGVGSNETIARRLNDCSAHLDKRSKQQHVISNSRFDLHSPKALYLCFRKQHSHIVCSHFVYEGGVFVRGR